MGVNNTTDSSHGPRVVRVAIVEDQRKFREATAAIIDGTEGFRCTGNFRSMEETLDKIRNDLPDVVLVDIGLPGMSGIGASVGFCQNAVNDAGAD